MIISNHNSHIYIEDLNLIYQRYGELITIELVRGKITHQSTGEEEEKNEPEAKCQKLDFGEKLMCMERRIYEIDTVKPFSESLIWQLNRDFYLKEGPEAWKNGMVPHHLTSNSLVGKTYAELIFAFLKDAAVKGQIADKIYILELGAGHGRLAYHTLKHLERLTDHFQSSLPLFCYVLSDIVEENLSFFIDHPQFQKYFDMGVLDVAHFDAVESKAIHLRHLGIEIVPGDLEQPLIVIANYFFDSIPSDLFYIKNARISSCSIALETLEDPKGMDEATLLEKIRLTFHAQPMESPHYEDPILNEILEAYRDQVFDAYLFFPHQSLKCVANLRKLSQKGLMVLSMDKGFHEIHELENAKEPEIITHGSFSIWVNYHAFRVFCEKHGGTSFFPAFSTFSSEVGCLLFLTGSESYRETKAAYQRFVNDFGPDDFNGLKKFTFKQIAGMQVPELLSMLRLSAYDSTMFVNMLPRIKQVSLQVTFNERKRLAQTMHQTWNMYFSLNEAFDLAYEIGGLFYDLGFYRESLKYFQHSVDLFGHKADVFYNKALCYYQLRDDERFLQTVKEGKTAFPTFEKFGHLDSLDLEAE